MKDIALVFLGALAALAVLATPRRPLDAGRVRLEDLGTGDLVLFRWSDVSPVHDTFSYFTHVGMVVVVAGRRWILETHLAGDGADLGTHRGGVNAYPLRARIDAYRGATYALVLRDRPDPRFVRGFAAEAWAKYRDVPFDDAYVARFRDVCLPRALGLAPRTARDLHRMNCAQLTGALLRDLGVANFRDHECLSPDAFLGLGSLAAIV